ncbi:endo alpha-1,4 polygalactosaminidase [Streptomyces sp. SID10362]|uniref:endo alpha-1,4 polygalactosaminidase n=1 Tax=Streptomyces sp. SID10362 TaxID=2706021 RepID=UPI0013C747D2|nr:endo alpha-1,4 polygalactosaminidase [Streptomyces sp. SID10362]NDZ71941.1 endo alpha-1,4 polygalactosaminidase [Streptomyces sp. SID10362]
MSRTQVHTRRKPVLAGLGATAVLVTAAALVPGSARAEAAAYSPPPAHAGFDYQIGGAYTPPAGVDVVSRDHTASPAPGLYNICYVNAFQAQPGAESDWDDDLLLRDANGDVVYDTDWGEAFLDIRTADKRERIAAKVGTWIDGCADKGFQAVEPDNYDSYTRAGDLLDAADAQGLIRLLAERAHSDGLAIGQKNTVELAPNREANGLDFAVAEECGEWDECGDYTAAFGDRVIVIEYTAKGLSKACAGFGDELSIVRRDLDVSPEGSSGYVRETC